jgi:hypothetical protein
MAENCFLNYQFSHVSQPPHTPDISPGDLFLFGDRELKFNGENFETLEELQWGIKELPGQINPEDINTVSRD